MKLANEQKSVIKGILSDLESKLVVTLGGYAGTGKTTVIKHLHHFLKNWSICAFTGKAANVLRRKGLDASTIHSLIYEPMKNPDGSIFIDKSGNPVFVLAQDLDCEGIIVDEASMVSKEIYNDLISFKKPILFVGDHGQLEPVGSDFNIMKEPDFVLEEIHRNAGEIAHFAEHIRKGFRAGSFKAGKCVKFVNASEAKALYTKVDQTICAYNKTRVEINVSTRVQLWGEDYQEKPLVGDKIMCLRNHKQVGLFNGMQGIVKFIYKKPSNKFIFSSDGTDYDVLFDPSQWNKDKYDFSNDRSDPHPFDYSNGITCHKSQGDEWDKGLVIEQKCDRWDHKRWAYTGSSRFKKLLYWKCHD
jgi:exodeoxyribonuclease-5